MKSAALASLLAVSVIYNASLPRWPKFSGVTAVQTAVGVGYTLTVAAWLAGPRRTLPRRLAWLSGAFAAAGIPMLIGDILRDRR